MHGSACVIRTADNLQRFLDGKTLAHQASSKAIIGQSRVIGYFFMLFDRPYEPWTGPAEGRVEAPLIQGLTQGLGLHHLGVDRRTGSDRGNAGGESGPVDVNNQVHPKPRRSFHLERQPSREISTWCRHAAAETGLAREERLTRHVQRNAGILPDRIEHDRFGKFGHGLSHNVDRFPLRAAADRVDRRQPLIGSDIFSIGENSSRARSRRIAC
jgi:hypothetical protein